MARPTLRATLWTGVGALTAALAAFSTPARSDSPKTGGSGGGNQPLTMATSSSCDGVRDLMVDTLVYQMVVGYGYGGYYGYGYGYGGYPAMDAVKSAAEPAPATAPSAGESMGGGGGGGGYVEPSH